VRFPSAAHFAACQERLELAIADACEAAGDWRGAVVGGVYAALELAAEDPAAALVLSERPAARWKEREPSFVAMVERLAALLSRDAPPSNPRLPAAETIVLCIARQVSLRIEVGRGEEMMEIAPDLAFLALMPFVGYAEARRCAQLTATA
jgi:hypothetical protein